MAKRAQESNQAETAKPAEDGSVPGSNKRIWHTIWDAICTKAKTDPLTTIATIIGIVTGLVVMVKTIKSDKALAQDIGLFIILVAFAAVSFYFIVRMILRSIREPSRMASAYLIHCFLIAMFLTGYAGYLLVHQFDPDYQIFGYIFYVAAFGWFAVYVMTLLVTDQVSKARAVALDKLPAVLIALKTIRQWGDEFQKCQNERNVEVEANRTDDRVATVAVFGDVFRVLMNLAKSTHTHDEVTLQALEAILQKTDAMRKVPDETKANNLDTRIADSWGKHSVR